MKTLDIEAVQAFVLVADLTSFTRAAEALDSTQSAISLKIKRLESGLGKRLLERTPRLVRLSAEGAAFLASARNLVAAHQSAIGSFAVEQRRLVVGISQHLVGPDLAQVLKRMSATDPSLVIELRIETSRAMLQAFDSGELDAAIVLRHDAHRRGGEVLLEEEFGWIAAPDFNHPPGKPLRLATQAEPCSVRAMAVGALDAAGIPWTEVFVGGGVATIGAAISAGLAIGALVRRVAPAGSVDLGPRLGLPKLPNCDVILYSNLTDAGARGALRTLGAAFRANAG
ncbi:DNA-binding transcriptional regulator, LysR family [Bradyrhizobium sp. NFR13]|jgi:DNA-binding transcriptional LysR family regulator|uniref:LysR family transcriptional regulator n=1 Tax=Bradyrhizobium sp. NFR13 TaxID=1566285 RepID=UPI0008E0D997|nr:LysR family transcriptional regulator [Bradyrhizobium sp. NFR13]SFM15489.1 DNA-binding transcriptional regulator, LysR family [Bradyrhizobium sp. NFR13]